MKTEVLTYIKKNGAASYAEPERFFDSAGFDRHGDSAITNNPDNTIFFWYGGNETAVGITMCLLRDGFIFKEARGLCHI